MVLCRKPLTRQNIGSLNTTDRFIMLGHIGVLIGSGAENLDHFRLTHMTPCSLLGQVVEIRLVHELLVLGHLVQLDADSFLLVGMLTNKYVLVDALCL